MGRIILILTVLSFSITIRAQTCNCLLEYQWAKKIFEDNDAGYPYYKEKIGIQAIESNNEKWEKEFIKTTDVYQCQSLLNSWLRFYRKGHIGISMEDQSVAPPSNSKGTGTSAVNTDISGYHFDTATFRDFAASLKQAGVEGIWTNGTYDIGIKKINAEYIGFVFRSNNANWKTGEVKFRDPVDPLSFDKGIYFMGDRSPARKPTSPFQLIGNTYLKAFDFYWKRVSPVFTAEPIMETELAALSAKEPYIVKLDEQTVLLRIPSFDDSYIKTVDSLVKANHQLLVSSKFMIIDIRGNGGGADRCYEPLPYLYTNPIRTMWVEFYSTPLNNARYDWIAKLDGFSEKEKQEYRDMKKKLDSNMGKFVNLNENGLTYSIDTVSTVFENPANIAVLADYGNASTAEQFILMAKQSHKVKIFGTKTFGALDFSNLNHVTSPSKNYKLYYTTSRSFRIPDMAIDDYGIQPDYYFDASIPEYQWIRETLKRMKTK